MAKLYYPNGVQVSTSFKPNDIKDGRKSKDLGTIFAHLTPEGSILYNGTTYNEVGHFRTAAKKDAFADGLQREPETGGSNEKGAPINVYLGGVKYKAIIARAEVKAYVASL